MNSHDHGDGASPGAPLWGAGPVPPVALVAVIVLVGTSLSVVYHYVMGAYLRLGYPYSSFLFIPKDHFMDYFNVYRYAQEFKPGVSSNMVYSPLLHLVMTVLNLAPAWVGFAALVGAFVSTLAVLLWAWTTRLVGNPVVRILIAAVLGMLAYPVLYALDRGNLEMLVFMTLAAFFYLYYWRQSPYAWIPLSFAVAAKYYWVTLVILLLLDRRFRQAAACIGAAVATSAVSMLAIALISGYSMRGVFVSLLGTLGGHVDGTGALAIASHSHSLWGWVICIIRWSDYAFYWLPTQRIYLMVAAVVFLLVVRRLMRGDFADWQKATALVACTLVLPYESMDYTLVHLLLPLTLFAATWRRGRRTVVSAVLFGLLLVPLDYYYFIFVYWRSTVSTSTLIYPVLLVALIVVVLWGHPEAAPSRAGLDGGADFTLRREAP